MSLRKFVSDVAFGCFVIVCCIIGIAVIREFVAEGRRPEASVATPEAKAMEAQEPEPRVRAADLIRAYEANEIRADLQYKGKIVVISGQVDNISSDIMGTPFVTLKHSDDFSFRSVQCLFSRSEMEELARLNSGERIVLRGRVAGELLMSVIVRDCSIVQRGAAQ